MDSTRKYMLALGAAVSTAAIAYGTWVRAADPKTFENHRVKSQLIKLQKHHKVKSQERLKRSQQERQPQIHHKLKVNPQENHLHQLQMIILGKHIRLPLVEMMI